MENQKINLESEVQIVSQQKGLVIAINMMSKLQLNYLHL